HLDRGVDWVAFPRSERTCNESWRYVGCLLPASDGAAVPRGHGPPLGTTSCLYSGPWHVHVPLGPCPRARRPSVHLDRGVDWVAFPCRASLPLVVGAGLAGDPTQAAASRHTTPHRGRRQDRLLHAAADERWTVWCDAC